MNQIEKSILNQMWIYCAALRTLMFVKLHNRYSAQFDLMIDNLRTASKMLLMEAERERKEVQMSVNVKV